MNWPDDFINKIICGDCLELMKEMPDECVDMIMTSPPYWGLRDYGIGPDQLGLEPNIELYIEHMTEIFNEIKRVLKKEGTLWLNIGDTYWSAKGSCLNPGGGKDSLESPKKEKGTYPLERGNKSDVPNLPQKCLVMIPERLAWSLIQDGWILRNKIIWYKPNAMPSSVKDRFSNRWEYLFMFSKSQHYYFDLDAVREPHKYDGRKDTMYKGGPKDMQIGKHERWPDPLGKNPGDIIADRKWNDVPGQVTQAIARDHGGWFKKDGTPIVDFEKGKNPGDFWEINTMPFPDAHFAVFPETLCEKPIKAGCPEQVCKKCGKARERIIEGTSPDAFNIRVRDVKENRIKHTDRVASQDEIERYEEHITHAGKGRHTVGWSSCKCNAGFKSGIVLDPFAGAGTVGVVAKKFGRQFILIDIKKEYCEMAEKRIAQVGYQMELRV